MRHDAEALLAVCDAEQVPASKILSISNIFDDPQYAARGNLVELDDPRVGPLVLAAPMPRMSLTPPTLRHAGPALGEANVEVFRTLLGLSATEYEDLRTRGVT